MMPKNADYDDHDRHRNKRCNATVRINTKMFFKEALSIMLIAEMLPQQLVWALPHPLTSDGLPSTGDIYPVHMPTCVEYATRDMQYATTCSMHQSACCLVRLLPHPLTSDGLPSTGHVYPVCTPTCMHVACSMQHVACSMQHVACSM